MLLPCWTDVNVFQELACICLKQSLESRPTVRGGGDVDAWKTGHCTYKIVERKTLASLLQHSF